MDTDKLKFLREEGGSLTDLLSPQSDNPMNHMGKSHKSYRDASVNLNDLGAQRVSTVEDQ